MWRRRPRTSATSPRQQARGFSLLELLVVLIVIVLITSMVSLTVSSGGQDIQLEANVRKLADVASFALDEAQMTGQDYGLLLEEVVTGEAPYFTYSWRERTLEGWREPAPARDVFATEQLPPEVMLELQLEDAPVVELDLEQQDEDEDKKDRPPSPQVVFYSSGETTVGAIEVRARDGGDLLWRIEWDLLGRFDVLRRGEAEEEEE